MKDKAFLKEYLLKPLCYAAVFLLVIFLLNKFTSFNFSLSSNSTINSFMVTGNGKITAVPNVAQTTFSINEKGKTQEEAKDAANVKQNKAIEILDSLGIKKVDIKTSSFNVNPNYDDLIVQPFSPASPDTAVPQVMPLKRTPNGYVADISTTVKAEKVEILNQAIDKLTALGINVGGVQYTFADEDSYKAQARTEAIHDAKKKAQELAKTAGFRVGNIISIQEEDQGGYGQPYAAMKTAIGAQDASTNLEPGSNEITSRVSITYIIKN